MNWRVFLFLICLRILLTTSKMNFFTNSESVPMLFAGLFPVDADQYENLRDALGKLRLNDAALSYEPETSGAMASDIHFYIDMEYDSRVILLTEMFFLQMCRVSASDVDS